MAYTTIQMELTDEVIASRVKTGDIHAFGVLVERYEAKLLRYARKFLFDQADAEDLVQEVFMKAYASIQSFDTGRNFSSWIYRVAHNEFINTLRKKGRQPLTFFDPDTLFPHPTAPEQADDELQRQELKAMVGSYIEKLEPKYREPLVLFFYEDMNYKQISQIMHIPVSTAGIRIKRAKEMLQKFYYSDQQV